MTGRVVRIAAALLAVTSACGADHMAGLDPRAFSSTAASVSASAERHRLQMTDAGSACSAEMGRYGAEVRPSIDRMAEMSGAMDACMERMGHVELADMAATCDEMRAELEGHLASGCAAQDPAAEAARHADAMQLMAAREAGRAEEMGGMMGSGGMMPGARCGM